MPRRQIWFGFVTRLSFWQGARDAATPGEWRYENLNWIGTPLFAVSAIQGPGASGPLLFDNIEPDANSYNNIEFIVAAHNHESCAMNSERNV